MEKNFAEAENRVRDLRQRPEPGASSRPPSIEEGQPGREQTGKEKARGEHSLNVYVSYELKARLLVLAEKYQLSLADVVRQLIKAGLPVFESLSASQEELLSGYIQLLRKSRSMGKLKK